MTLDANLRELEIVRRLLREAGTILLDHRKKVTGIQQKEDKSWVSDADRASSQFLYEQIRAAFPEYAILDEEREDDGSRYEREECCVIDPLDASKEYIEGRDEFSILFGKLRRFEVVFAAAYRPMNDEMAFAVRGRGAYIGRENAFRTLKAVDETARRVLVTRSRMTPELERVLARIRPDEVYQMGGSIKLIEVAKGAGSIFIAPRGAEMKIWDLCGTSLIAEEAGLKVTDHDGNPLNFAQRDLAYKNGILVAHPYLHEKVLRDMNK